MGYRAVSNLRRLFFLSVFIFIWTIGGREAPSNDAAIYVSVARSIVLDGTIALPYHSPGYTVIGSDGKVYAKYPLPWSLALVPEAALERLISVSDLNMTDKELYIRIIRAITPAIFGALAMVLLFSALTAKSVPIRRALFITIAFHLGTFALPYLKSHYSEVFQIFCVNLALLAMVRFQLRTSCANAALLGFAVGLLVLAKVTLALFAIAIAFGAFLSTPRSERLTPKPWACFFITLAPLLSIFAWYNDLRFGAYFVTHYADYLVPEQLGHSIPEGLYGLLFSTGRGLIWYAPLALLGFVAAIKASLRREASAICIFSGVIATTLFYASWTIWHGAEQWGPRFLVTMIGPLGWLSEPIFCRKTWDKVATVLLIAAGLLVNIPAVLVNPQRFYTVVPYRPYSEYHLDEKGKPLEPVDPDNLRRINFSPSFSPIFGHMWLLKHAILGEELESDAPWRDELRPDEPIVRNNTVEIRLDLWYICDPDWSLSTCIKGFTILFVQIVSLLLLLKGGLLIADEKLKKPHPG